jgi:ribosomal protein S18 acetylase RimI-like enzyme
VTIRPARLDDVPALLAIEDASFATDRLTARKIRRLLAHGNCALLVAAERGVVVGYALVLFRRGALRARLYGIAVSARHRRRGLGARLLLAAEREAAGRRRRSMSLETAPDNEAALKLYRKMGYVRVARLGPYYEDGAVADRYVKGLPRRPQGVSC